MELSMCIHTVDTMLRTALYAEEVYNEKDYDDRRLPSMTPTGYAPLPRYFTIRFKIQRVQNNLILRPEDPAKTLLCARAQQLRDQGISYPQIARLLGISVGTAWNYTQHSD